MAYILVGASVLAIPVGFSEEIWALGSELSIWNIVVLSPISIILIALYVCFTFYSELFNQYRFEHVKRAIAIYLLSLVVVAILLTEIPVASWGIGPGVALKPIVIAPFPASRDASVSNAIS